MPSFNFWGLLLGVRKKRSPLFLALVLKRDFLRENQDAPKTTPENFG
jgi:hypothetical protein